MKVTVLVRPKAGILDPQGEAVRDSLVKLGFPVTRAQVGRVIDLDVDAASVEEATRGAERMCAELLANELIEGFQVQVEAQS